MSTHFNKLYRKDLTYFGHIEGLRALAAFRVMLYHMVLFGALFVGPSAYTEMTKHPLFKIALSTGVLLDTFFVISGLVIGYALIKEYQEHGKVNLYRFVVRRCARVYPLYILVLLLCFPLSYTNFHNIWSNLLQINNLLPITEQYLAWTWSLAVDFQFYLLFGAMMWLLSKKIIGKKICYALLIGFVLLPFIVIPLIISSHQYYHLTSNTFLVTSPESWAYLNFGFDKLHVRSSPILYGVLTAYVLAYHRNTLHQYIQRIPNGFINLITLGLVAIIAFLVATDPVWFFDQSPNAWATSTYWVTLYQRIIFSLTLCLLLLLADAPKGIVMRSIVTVLSSIVLRPFGRLSFSTFMLHPIVLTLGFLIYVPTHPTITAPLYFQFGLWMILLIYFIAMLSFLYIEQPTMRWIKQKLLRAQRPPEGIIATPQASEQ